MTKYRVYIENKGESWELIYDTDSTDITRSIISPCIKLETNKASGFDFTINRGHPSYDGFTEFKTFVYVFRDYDTYKEKCLFRGRVSEINTDVFGQRTISCEGDLAILADSIQSPNTFINVQTIGTTKKKKNVVTKTASMFVGDFFSSVITTHNNQMMEGYGNDSRKQFRVGAISHSKSTESKQFDLTSYSDTSSVLSSEILGRFGGIIRTRYIRSESITYIDWIEDYTESSNQDIRFGVNLLDLDMDQPDDKPWSILLPIGNDGITIKDATPSEAISGVSIFNNIYLKNSDAFSKYGWVVHYEKFDDAKTANDLIHKAYEYMWTHKKEIEDNQKQLTVKAIDLQLLGESDDPLDLGDKILVKMNVEGNLGIEKIPCIEMTIDIQNPENNSYTLGNIALADDKGKATLTSQHSSRSKSTSAKVNYLSDEIDGLQRDVDTLGNNVNINAENIKAVAKDIAVVAENLTIAAQNIAITANTIDVKAQELTATFEDEIGDAKTKITATKEGIISEFNQKIYGPELDGKAGIVGDYSRRVEESAKRTKDWMHAVLYDGNPDDPQEIAFYNRVITDSAEGTKEILYGVEKDPENPSDSSAFKAIYNRSLKEFSSTLFGPAGKPDDYEPGKIWSQIKQNSKSITLKVTDDSTRKQSKIEIQRDNVTVSSDNINLNGYVLASEIAAERATFSSMTSGSGTLSNVYANNLKAVTELDIGDTNNAATLKYRGYEYTDLLLQMGSVTTSRLFLGYTTAGYSSTVDLDHSHTVSVSSNGTVTLGPAVDTDASGRSFRIADTKTYKDGVSAAGQVTVDRVYQTPGQYMGGSSRLLYVPVTAEASTLTDSDSKTETIHVICTSAYDEGVTETVDSTNIQLTASDSVTYNDYDSSVQGPALNVIATSRVSWDTTTTTKSKIETFKVPADAAVEAGKSKVNITNVTYSNAQAYSIDPTYLQVYRTVTLSRSAPNTISSWENIYAKPVYDAGYDVGYDAGVSDGKLKVYAGGVICTGSTYNASDRTQKLNLSIGIYDSDNNNYLTSSYAEVTVGAGAAYDDALNNHVGTDHILITGVTVNANGSASVFIKFKRTSETSGWTYQPSAITVDSGSVKDYHS